MDYVRVLPVMGLARSYRSIQLVPGLYGVWKFVATLRPTVMGVVFLLGVCVCDFVILTILAGWYSWDAFSVTPVITC